MRKVSLTLLTIVADGLLEERLVREMKQMGVRGYTVTEARGEGMHGAHTGEVEGRNIKIKTLLAPELAEQLLAYLAEHYFPIHALIAYTTTVEVVRGEKYL